MVYPLVYDFSLGFKAPDTWDRVAVETIVLIVVSLATGVANVEAATTVAMLRVFLESVCVETSNFLSDTAVTVAKDRVNVTRAFFSLYFRYGFLLLAVCWVFA